MLLIKGRYVSATRNLIQSPVERTDYMKQSSKVAIPAPDNIHSLCNDLYTNVSHGQTQTPPQKKSTHHHSCPTGFRTSCVIVGLSSSPLTTKSKIIQYHLQPNCGGCRMTFSSPLPQKGGSNKAALRALVRRLESVLGDVVTGHEPPCSKGVPHCL